MKGAFRKIVESEKTKTVVQYAPNLSGGLPSFLDQASRMEKFLKACTITWRNTTVKRENFSTAPFKDVFDGRKISDQDWYLGFKAMSVSQSFKLVIVQGFVKLKS